MVLNLISIVIIELAQDIIFWILNKLYFFQVEIMSKAY